MAVETWISGNGVGLTWTDAFASGDLNIASTGLANGRSMLSSNGAITNGTAKDIFADLSINFASVTTVAPNFLGVYLYPLNQDGTTYGDGQYTAGTSSTAVPSSSYWVGNIIAPIGTQAVVGQLNRIILPPGSFLFLIYNQLGVATATSGNSIKYRTYNRAVV